MTQTKSVGSRREKRVFRIADFLIALGMFVGLCLLIYPSAARWVSQYNLSNVIVDQLEADIASGRIGAEQDLQKAREYNNQLIGLAMYSAGTSIAESQGTYDGELDYFGLLRRAPSGMMARLQIPSINVDLPVYHGTSDSVLLKGVGHLQGTALPVGTTGGRPVLTAHRGLAESKLFTDLDQVELGDRFTIQVAGDVLSYEISEIRIIAPVDTIAIRPKAGRDLVTLVTCTPLGVNSHRILVTGERITTVTSKEVGAMTSGPNIPGFPWWLVVLIAGTVLIFAIYRSLGHQTKQ